MAQKEAINLLSLSKDVGKLEPVSSQDIMDQLVRIIPAELAEALRTTLRREIRTEEIAILRTELREGLTDITSGLTDLALAVHAEHRETREFLTDTIAKGAVATVSVIKSATPTSAEADTDRLAEGEVLITDLEMDFLEVHSAIAKSVIDRRPILLGVRSGFTDKNEPQLTISRGTDYGVDHHMRNVFLIFRIHEADPVVEGEYWDAGFGGGSGRNVPLVQEQLTRILQTLVEKAREATGFDPTAESE